MRFKLSCAMLLACTTLAHAQTAVSTSRSDSAAQSGAVAIGGGNATGGNGSATASGGNINIAASPASTQSTSTQTIHQDVSGTQTLKNVPLVSSPGLTAAGIETCLGSASGGGAFVGTGFSLGTTYPDNDCNRRLYARTLWAMAQAVGAKDPKLSGRFAQAATAELCLSPDINYVMSDICAQVLPQRAQAAAPVVYAQTTTSPSPASYYYEDASTYRGGPIMLVSSRTGAEYLCNDYDLARQRCRDGHQVVKPHRPSAKPKAMAVAKPKAASPVPVPQDY